MATRETHLEQHNQSVPKRRTYIGVKLIFLISSLVIISMGLITFLVSYFVTADTRINAEANNITLNSRTAYDIENRINSVKSSATLFYDLLLESAQNNNTNFSATANKFFNQNKDIACIGYYDSTNLVENQNVYINHSFFEQNKIQKSNVINYLQTQNQTMKNAQQGIEKVQNPSPFFKTPMMCIFFPVTLNQNTTQGLFALFSTEQLSQSIATGKINESILINDEGIILVHPDVNKILKAEDYSENVYARKILSNLQDSSEDNTDSQKTYVDLDGTEYYAVSKQITNADCKVITQVRTNIVLAAIRTTTRRNIALTFAILFIAILIIWIYAQSLSIPLEKLTQITDEINQGNFNTPLFNKLNIRRTDEIGVLNRSTKNEQDILNTVTSLTNKGVTKAIVTKAIDFAPHLKDVTIFFSDIRGFTSISDSFNKKFGSDSAAQIINFLNDYMSRMVNCVTATGGIIDKFEGDAVMAAWGVLRDDDLSFEQLPDTNEEKKIKQQEHLEHVKNDALCAITSTLAMRYALTKYNKDAQAFTEQHKNEANAKYMPHIKIGCGLNSGRATVGFMGSDQKMEFTSIGDSVNLASRTESSNKPCGTDILITQDTFNLLSDYIKCEQNNFTIKPENSKKEIIAEKIPVAFEVKGKGTQYFYGIVNMPNLDIEKFFKRTDENFVLDMDCAKTVGKFGPKTLKEVRKLLDIPEPDFKGVNLDAEENKVKTV